MTEKFAQRLENFINGINHCFCSNQFPDVALNHYKDLIMFGRCHFAAIDTSGNAVILEHTGNNEYDEIYYGLREHDPFIPKNRPLITKQQTHTFAVPSRKVRTLDKKNPLIHRLNKYRKISGIYFCVNPITYKALVCLSLEDKGLQGNEIEFFEITSKTILQFYELHDHNRQTGQLIEQIKKIENRTDLQANLLLDVKLNQVSKSSNFETLLSKLNTSLSRLHYLIDSVKYATLLDYSQIGKEIFFKPDPNAHPQAYICIKPILIKYNLYFSIQLILKPQFILTEREEEIILMIKSGASNQEISQTLFLSQQTVKKHLSNIFAKTGIKNRTQLALKVGGHLHGID